MTKQFNIDIPFEYRLNGVLHRDDNLPAHCGEDGTLSWWVNGKLHRTDGPALIDVSGTIEYWQNDQLHREGGPAVIYATGKKLYYLRNVEISEKDFYEQT